MPRCVDAASGVTGLSGIDLLSAFEDGFGLAKVDVGGCQVSEALVVAAVVVMIDEVADGMLEGSKHAIIFQQDAVFQGLTPSLNFALCLWVVWGGANVIHPLLF